MNCTTISLARTATNGCAAATAMNGSAFLAATATATAVVNGTSAKNAVSNNLQQQNQQYSSMTNNQFKPQKSNLLKTTTAAAALTMNADNSQTTNTTTAPTKKVTSKRPELAAKIVQQSNIICFDVDSTVIREEGIDELAEFCGKGSEVSRVTKEAMGGAMTFQDALTIRLNIIRPTQKQISDFIKLHPSTLTHNVKRFIAQLRADGKQVYLISGGFDCLIEPVAHELGIPLRNLYANKLMFYHNGEYAAFDTTQPTSKSGGKAEAISIIKSQNPDALITMIGDGATDLEAVPPANYFIGFGGNVVRAEVHKRAQYYVTDFEELITTAAATTKP